MRVLSLFFPRLGIQLARNANPLLAGRPLALLAGEGDEGLLSIVSCEATAAGVEPGMTALQARQRCPGITLERDNAGECLERLEAVVAILRTRATTNVAIVSRNSLALSLDDIRPRFADETSAATSITALARSWSGLDVRAAVAGTVEQAESAARKARRFPLIQPDEGVSQHQLPRYDPISASFAWDSPVSAETARVRIARLVGTLQPVLETQARSYRAIRLDIEHGAYRSSVVLRTSQPMHRASDALELLRSRTAHLELDATTAVRITLESVGPSVLVEPSRPTIASVHQLAGPAVPLQRRLLRAS